MTPVDWKAWGLLDYPQKIKQPMDLGTIQLKLKQDKYALFEDFQADVRLVWKNCMIYNAVCCLLIFSILIVIIEWYTKQNDDSQALMFTKWQ